MPFELTYGHFMCGLVGGCYQVSHGFSLTEVHFPVHVCPHGVFSGFGLSASVGNESLNDLRDDIL